MRLVYLSRGAVGQLRAAQPPVRRVVPCAPRRRCPLGRSVSRRASRRGATGGAWQGTRQRGHARRTVLPVRRGFRSSSRAPCPSSRYALWARSTRMSVEGDVLRAVADFVAGRRLPHRHREAVGTGVAAYCNGFRMPSRCWMRWTTFRRSTAAPRGGQWSTARAWWRRTSPAFWYPPRALRRRFGEHQRQATVGAQRLRRRGSPAGRRGAGRTPAGRPVLRLHRDHRPLVRLATGGTTLAESVACVTDPARRSHLRRTSRGRCRAMWNCCPPASITRRCGPCRGSPSG